MDALALSRELDRLEKSWAVLDSSLDFWTLLVAIGVAVEVVVLVIEFVREWRDFRRAVIHSPDRPSIVLFALGLLGAGLVAIGVAEEFRVHTKAGEIEAQLRDKTRQLVAIVNAEAAKADERARSVESANKTLQQQLKTQREQERRRANELAKQAEDERLARARIEEKINPRRLSLKDKEAIQSAILPFPNTIVHVEFAVNAPDGPQYAEDFKEVFVKSGWSLPRGGPILSTQTGTGLWIRIRDSHDAAAVALQRVLKTLGIDAKGQVVPDMKADEIEIFIGPRE